MHAQDDRYKFFLFTHEVALLCENNRNRASVRRPPLMRLILFICSYSLLISS